MLQEIETGTKIDVINLSSAAASAVKGILTERNLDGYALRVYVSGSGCCGAQFGMALDNNIRGNDFTFEAEGVKVVVDETSIDYLRGAKIDFVNDPQRGAGFVVDSPVSLGGGSCACGSKSEEGHGHAEGESCACGGSCSCNN
jgi:iron-sulfur cluster assembly accessory protein